MFGAFAIRRGATSAMGMVSIALLLWQNCMYEENLQRRRRTLQRGEGGLRCNNGYGDLTFGT